MTNYVQHWTQGCQVPTDGERRALWSYKYYAGGYRPAPTLFAEQLARRQQEDRMTELQIRQREVFADRYAMMEAATANCRDEDEDETDLG